MAGHTSDGCTIANTGFSGSLQASNCYVSAPNQASNAGCGISASSAQSYGAGFNSAGGGVYATEWTSSAISIWFWPRNAIPGDVSGGNPNPAGWGTPVAKFAGGCDIDAKFKDMQIVWIFLFPFIYLYLFRSLLYTPPPPLIHGKKKKKKKNTIANTIHRSSTLPSAATGPAPSGTRDRAPPEQALARISSLITPVLSVMRTGGSIRLRCIGSDFFFFLFLSDLILCLLCLLLEVVERKEEEEEVEVVGWSRWMFTSYIL